MPSIKFSVIINNYNYGDFLEESINSVLLQKYQDIELIVVDDGSKDHSRQIIEKYQDQLISIFKENGGQASALNLGFYYSKGDIILFLDADDCLYPHAIYQMATCFVAEKIVKCHGKLKIIDDKSKAKNYVVPTEELSEGNLCSLILKYGPESYVCPPTSGNAWSRSFLEKVLPIPENEYRTSADAYLFTLAPLFGNIAKVKSCIGMYRIHDTNNYWQNNFSLDKLNNDIIRYESRVKILEKYAKKLGFDVNPEDWKKNNRYYLARLDLRSRLNKSYISSYPVLICIYSVINSKIKLHKKILWIIWFFAVRHSPKLFIVQLGKLFFNLKMRIKLAEE